MSEREKEREREQWFAFSVNRDSGCTNIFFLLKRRGRGYGSQFGEVVVALSSLASSLAECSTTHSQPALFSSSSF